MILYILYNIGNERYKFFYFLKRFVVPENIKIYFAISFLFHTFDLVFIKSIVKTDKDTGKIYQYYRLCESFRIGNKTRHRNILSLGKLQELPSETDRKILADRIEHLLTNTSGLFDHEVGAVIEKLAIEFSNVLRRKASEEVPLLQQEATAPGAEEESQSDFEHIDTKTFRHEDV